MYNYIKLRLSVIIFPIHLKSSYPDFSHVIFDLVSSVLPNRHKSNNEKHDKNYINSTTVI